MVVYGELVSPTSVISTGVAKPRNGEISWVALRAFYGRLLSVCIPLTADRSH